VEEDYKRAAAIFEQQRQLLEARSGDAERFGGASKLTGLSPSALARRKGVEMLGLSEEQLWDDLSKQLAGLGMGGRRATLRKDALEREMARTGEQFTFESVGSFQVPRAPQAGAGGGGAGGGGGGGGGISASFKGFASLMRPAGAASAGAASARRAADPRVAPPHRAPAGGAAAAAMGAAGVGSNGDAAEVSQPRRSSRVNLREQVRACVRASVRACERACLRACVRALADDLPADPPAGPSACCSPCPTVHLSASANRATRFCATKHGSFLDSQSRWVCGRGLFYAR
jgi:hypothetical protein